MDAVGAVGARRKYREAPTPNEAGGGTCMLRRAIIPLTCMFYCRVYLLPGAVEIRSGTGLRRRKGKLDPVVLQVIVRFFGFLPQRGVGRRRDVGGGRH